MTRPKPPTLAELRIRCVIADDPDLKCQLRAGHRGLHHMTRGGNSVFWRAKRALRAAEPKGKR